MSTPPSAKIHDLPNMPEKPKREMPRNKNQMPTMMRSTVTLAEIWLIKMMPNIISISPIIRCQPRLLSLLPW